MASQVVNYRTRTSRGNLQLPLTLVALLCAAITPNVFVAGGLELLSAAMLAKYVLLPAVVIQLAILFYARGAGYSRLLNRLVTGIWVGLIATTGLDVVRQPGTFFGYLSHDETRMAGEMILGTGHGHGGARPHAEGEKHVTSAPKTPHGDAASPGAEPTHAGGASEKYGEGTSSAPQKRGDAGGQPAHGALRAERETKAPGTGAHHVGAADFVGYAYHYWNGASFAVIYALLFGRTPWWGPVVYSLLFIETGMLLFMQAAMGPLTWGVVLVSFLAHVVYGLVLGVLLSRFLRDEGTILQLITGPKLQRAS